MIVNSDRLLYKKVADYIKLQIRRGEWSEKIPPQRTLSEELQVNRSTVIKAIEELRSEGLLEKRVNKKGIFIKKEFWSELSLEDTGWGKTLPNKGYAYDGEVGQFLRRMRKNKKLINLGNSDLGGDFFRSANIKKVVEASIPSLEVTEDREISGNAKLKRSLIKKLEGVGIRAGEDNILIATSSTQALYLLFLGLLPRFSQILTGELSKIYDVKLSRVTQMVVKEIKMAGDGVDIDDLAKKLNPHKTNLIYLEPSSHNPTGKTMTLEGRKKLIEVSKKYKVPIIEEDYSKLLMKDKLPQTLKELGGDSVVYISDFSRVFSPNLTMGYIVAERGIIKRLTEIKTSIDLGVSYFTQEVLANFLESQEYEENLKEIAHRIEEKREGAEKLLNSYLKGLVEWEINSMGYYIWLDMRKLGSELDLLNTMVNNGVLLYPGSLYGKKGKGYYRMSFCRYDDETMERGIKIIRDVIKRIQLTQRSSVY